MKRALCFLLALLLCIPLVSFAENEETGKNSAAENQVDLQPFTVNATGAVLMEATTGKMLFAQNEDHSASPASVTKIMTLLLTMEAIDGGKIALTDHTRISAYAASMGGSQVYLEEGEDMSVEDLLKCTVISSANDAAVALAELVAGSEDAFISKMNARAKELGMDNSHFENVTGLDDTTTNHVTSAEDIAIMSRELLKHRTILNYSSIWQDTIRNGSFTLTNTNRLVRFYEGCNGLKTGSTDKAGYCVSVSAKRGNLELIAVIMGAETRDSRNAAARTLLDYGFSNFGLYESPATTVERVPVLGGTQEGVNVCHKGFSCVVDKSGLGNVEVLYDIPETLKAPVLANDPVGKITYKLGDTVIGEVDLVAEEDVPKITFLEIFWRMLQNILIGK